MSVVESVNWLDRSADEAELAVGDGHGGQTLSCYAQPFDGHAGATVEHPLLVFESRGAVRVGHRPLGQVRDSRGLGSTVTAVVDDVRGRRLTVGGVHLEMDLPLPGDIKAGDVVEFHCDRLIFMG